MLPEIDALFGIPNTRDYHPEVDSGVHTLMVLSAAVELSDDPMVRFAAIMHDLGKAATPMAEWPKHHGHEERGIPTIDALCERLRIPVDYRKFAIMVSRFHLTIHRLFELNAKTIVKIFEQTDAFRRPQLFEKLLLVCEADAQGCGRKIDYKQGQNWRYLLQECSKISAQTLIVQGYQGEAIKEALHQRRVACADLILNSWEQHEKQ